MGKASKRARYRGPYHSNLAINGQNQRAIGSTHRQANSVEHFLSEAMTRPGRAGHLNQSPLPDLLIDLGLDSSRNVARSSVPEDEDEPNLTLSDADLANQVYASGRPSQAIYSAGPVSYRNYPTQPVNPITAFDCKIEEALRERVIQLTPTAEELVQMEQTVFKVQDTVQTFVDLGHYLDYYTSVKVNSVHRIGSYPMETMLRGERSADLVIILENVPLKCNVVALLKKIVDQLSQFYEDEVFTYVMGNRFAEILEISTGNRVLLHFATVPENINRLRNDKSQIDRVSVFNSFNAVQHALWFKQTGAQYNDNVVTLIRIMKDISRRFRDFKQFSPWMNTVLCHHIVTNVTGDGPLPLARAFKCVLEAMAYEIFCPYTNLLPDPINPYLQVHRRIRRSILEDIYHCANVLVNYMFKEETMDEHKREIVLKTAVGLMARPIEAIGANEANA